MNKFRFISLSVSFVVGITAFFFVSCTPQDEDKVLGNVSFIIERELPEGVSDLQVKSEEVSFVNITTGEVKKYSSSTDPHINGGLYNIHYQAECNYSLNGAKRKGRLVAKLHEIILLPSKSGKSIVLHFKLHIVPTVKDLIIEEIFFAGTLHPSGKQYNGDNYVVLYNGTDKTLYADGIAFCETEFLSCNNFDYVPDIRHEAVCVHAVYVIPGNGKEHPVKPGERFIFCDTGIDHRTNNPNSFDLTKADYEWYDVSTVPTHHDFDSPVVPNMDKWYCYTFSFFILHKRGYRSYIIARTQTTKQKFLKDYVYKFSYKFTHNGLSTTVHSSYYKIPNAWVIDGVNLSVETEYKFNVLPEEIDAGWTYCGRSDKDRSRFFRSVRRKYLGKDANGNKILQDTNNSTEDFNPMVIPSLIEEQGTAIDAQGTPCKTKTYDGIVPIDTKKHEL